MKNTDNGFTKFSIRLLMMTASLVLVAHAASAADDLSAYEKKQAVLRQHLRATTGKKHVVCTGNPLGDLIADFNVISVDEKSPKMTDITASIKVAKEFSPARPVLQLKVTDSYLGVAGTEYRFVVQFEPAVFKIGPDNTPNNTAAITAFAFGAMEEISDHEGLLLPYNGISALQVGTEEGAMVVTCLDTAP
jgi:hypothetical protein